MSCDISALYFFILRYRQPHYLNQGLKGYRGQACHRVKGVKHLIKLMGGGLNFGFFQKWVENRSKMG